MRFFVYILQSQVDASYYIGYTRDIPHRLGQHNSSKTGYSAKKRPWKLVYSESFNDKSQAIKRERFLKNQKSREFIQKLIAN